MPPEIEITLNGFQEKVPRDSTLSDLLDLYQERDAHLIVERNGRFVYPRDYSATQVSAGDVIEFINPDFGG